MRTVEDHVAALPLFDGLSPDAIKRLIGQGQVMKTALDCMAQTARQEGLPVPPAVALCLYTACLAQGETVVAGRATVEEAAAELRRAGELAEASFFRLCEGEL